MVQGSGGGVFAWTNGSGHNATINNSGHVLTQGIGNLASGIGLSAVSNNANVTITNHASGTVSALNNAMNGFSLAGAGVVTLQNDGLLTSQQKDGISSFDPATGLIPTFGTASATNNGTIDSSRHGINLAAVGDTTVTLGDNSEINAGTSTSGTGVFAGSIAGNVLINASATSETNSASGPGVVGVSLTGASTVNAGVVNSGSGAVDLFGLTIPAIPGLPTLSGGVLSLANGDAVANAHGDIMTTGSFGVLALSLNGNATTTADAGITVDPPIGMASISFGPNASTVTNNGTQITTAVGLLGVNLGSGTVSITNSTTGKVDATSGAGVVAIKVGAGNNTLPGGNSVVVSNDNVAQNAGGGVIDAPNGPGVSVIALDPLLGTANNVLVSNTNFASITGAGGLLAPAVGVLADGNVAVDNLNDSAITNTIGTGGIAVGILAGGDVSVTNDVRSMITGNIDVASLTGTAAVLNDHRSTWNFSGISVIGGAIDATLTNDRGSQINGTNALLGLVAGNNAMVTNDRGADLNLSGLSTNLMFAGNDASILNDRGGSFNMNGISANVMVAANDASITNRRGGSFSIDGITGGNFMFAGNNASITNERGGSFSMSSLLNANVMVAGGDATISNDFNGSFSLTGLASGNFMFAGGNASISNDNNSSTTFANLVGANLMVANSGSASITNDRGSDFSMLGLANGNFMFAGTDATILNDRGGSTTFANLVGTNLMIANTGTASITNDRGGDFSMLGLANGNFMFGGTDATILNDRGGSFTMVDLLNGNAMVAGSGNASITNDRGGSFTLAGINGNVMVAANGNTEITNDRGGDFTLLGLTGSLMAAGNDATISNSRNGTFNIIGASGDVMVAANNITIDNDTGAVINLLGLNTLGFVAGGSSTLNNNSTVRVGGLFGLPGAAFFIGLDQFNNAGELTMMNNVIGDLTYTSGNYTGANGLLSSDVFLDGAGGSSSDLLHIDGLASGTTLIAVNDLHGGPATYDPTGTKLVFAFDAASGPVGSEFALRDGPIDYGLFTYDLRYVYTADDPSWWLSNGPNGRAFELASLPSQIQNMVGTVDATWHDRTADLRDAEGVTDGGGGVWAKAVGSLTGRDHNQSYTDMNGLTFTYKGHSDQAIGGVVGGADAVINTDDMDILVGLLGSYTASSTDFGATGTHVGISGVGAGAYATVLKDGFFLDALGRVQFLGIDYATAAPWADTASPNAQSYSVVVDAGYRAEMGGVAVEPLATVAYNKVVIDSFALLGNSVSFDQQESLRGRLGVRVSGDAGLEQASVSPFLEANLWNEFLGDNTATITGGAMALTLHDNTSGLSGEIKGGFDVVSDNGWSGFVSAQYRKSASASTVGAQAGLRMDF